MIRNRRGTRLTRNLFALRLGSLAFLLGMASAARLDLSQGYTVGTVDGVSCPVPSGDSEADGTGPYYEIDKETYGEPIWTGADVKHQKRAYRGTRFYEGETKDVIIKIFGNVYGNFAGQKRAKQCMDALNPDLHPAEETDGWNRSVRFPVVFEQFEIEEWTRPDGTKSRAKSIVTIEEFFQDLPTEDKKMLFKVDGDRSGLLPSEVYLSYLVQAVREFQTRGVAHRDLHFGNIIYYEWGGNPFIIIDYDLAVVMKSEQTFKRTYKHFEMATFLPNKVCQHWGPFHKWLGTKNSAISSLELLQVGWERWSEFFFGADLSSVGELVCYANFRYLAIYAYKSRRFTSKWETQELDGTWKLSSVQITARELAAGWSKAYNVKEKEKYEPWTLKDILDRVEGRRIQGTVLTKAVANLVSNLVDIDVETQLKYAEELCKKAEAAIRLFRSTTLEVALEETLLRGNPKLRQTIVDFAVGEVAEEKEAVST